MMKRKIKHSIIIISLIIIYIYVLVTEGISENYVIFEGENLPIKTIFGLNIQNENKAIEASANTGKKTIEDVRNNNFTA